MTTSSADLLSVHLVSLGCARNDVDSEELAARLEAGGFRLTSTAEEADAVMVNTCGFVTTAKKDSLDTLLAAADLKDGDGPTRAVVAVGCLAERYGQELAAELPEADAVLSFDDYSDIATRLQSILAGQTHVPHAPRDRRALLPISPTQRPAARLAVPGHQHRDAQPQDDRLQQIAPASGPSTLRRRLSGAPWAPLKLASGCDRRCTFCAIPAFRGSYLSRPPAEVLSEARWLADQGVSEVFLVSENTSSYGKDLGDLRALEKLLPDLAAVEALSRVRVSYLQPAEMRPGLVEAIAGTPGVAAYFDLSFQHASASVLRRMRRFGGTDAFLELIESVRRVAPEAGIRSNVICGFPGESDEDLEVLADFLTRARLDAIGVFGYSDEDGTEAAGLDGQLPEVEIERRRAEIADLAEELVAQRAEERVGSLVEVLVETIEDGMAAGRAAHQGPEVDGQTTVTGTAGLRVGDWVSARVVGSDGVDLWAESVR